MMLQQWQRIIIKYNIEMKNDQIIYLTQMGFKANKFKIPKIYDVIGIGGNYLNCIRTI